MIRKREKKHNVRRQGRVKIREPEHAYSESEGYMGSKRWGYETRKPIERYHSEYNYNFYEDSYRPGSREDEYSVYDSRYDTDDDDTYTYNSRTKYYDDYYDTPEYSSYYDKYDSIYKEEGSHSECRTCKKHGKSRSERTFDDSSFLYRYEEGYPKYRHSHSYNKKNKINTSAETNHTRLRNDRHMDIYAIQNILGQKGFKYKRHSTTEPLTSEFVSETGVDSEGYKRNIQKIKRKPEYHVYNTQTMSIASVFDKKIKNHLPERLISVTDYEEPQVLAYTNKNKLGYIPNNESDLVYLPVVMKTKYKKGKVSEQNLNNLKANKKDITVYTVSGRPSNIFRKAKANSYNPKKTENKTKNDFTKQIPKRSFVYTASEVRNDDIMSLVTSRNISKSDLRQNNVEPTDQSDVNERNNSADGQQRAVSGLQHMETKNPNNQMKSIIKPKNTRVSKTSYANDQPYLRSNLQYSETSTTEMDTEGQYPMQSILKQNTAAPKIQNIEEITKSPVYEQENSISNLQNANKNFQNIFLLESQSSTEGIKHLDTLGRNVTTLRDLEDKENTTPKSILRHPSHAFKDQSHIFRRSLVRPEQIFDSSANRVNLNSMYGDQEMEKEKQNIQKSMVKQSSVVKKSQGYIDSDQLTGIEGERLQKSMVRQSGVALGDQVMRMEGQNKQKNIAENNNLPQTGKGIEEQDEIIGVEDESKQKSMIRQSLAAQRGRSLGQSICKSKVRQSIVPEINQSFMARDQVMGTEGKNIRKSTVSQSVAQRNQSFVDRDQSIATERDKTMRSTARPSTIPQRQFSFINNDQVMGTEGTNIRKSTVSQSVAQRNQSFVDRDQSIATERDKTMRSTARPSTIPQRQFSFINNDQIMETEGQSTQQSIARQFNVPRKGQSFVDRKQTMETDMNISQKNLGRQSSVARKSQGIVDNDQIIEVEEDDIKKSKAGKSILLEGRQSIADRGEVMRTGGQSVLRNITRKSNTAQRGQSFVDRTQSIETENKTTPKSMVRQSSVAPRDQTFLDGGKSSFSDQYKLVNGLQEFETLSQQPQVSVFRPSTVYKHDQKENSTVRQQSLGRNENGSVSDIPQSPVEFGTSEELSKQLQSNAKLKRLSKTKSKSLIKRALSKLSAFQGHSGKVNNSASTAPVLDAILNEQKIEQRIEYERPSPSPQPLTNEPLIVTSTESLKQPEVSKKAKKSRTSKLKSLLWKPKKSEPMLKSKSNSEDAQPTRQSVTDPKVSTYQPNFEQQPLEFDQTSQQSTSEISTEVYSELKYQEPKENSDQFLNSFETKLKEYDISPVIYFLQIAQLIIGVTIFEKLMEVLEVM